MATVQEHQQLKAIRFRHKEAATDWEISRSGEELFAIIVPGTQPVAIATLSADCDYPDRDFLLHAYQDMKLLLRLFDEACDVIRSIRQSNDRTGRQTTYGRPASKPADYAAECAMKCGDQRFLTFLRERHAVDTSDGERVKTAVRDLLKVGSRAELNSNAAAAGRWKNLKGDFDLWMRT